MRCVACPLWIQEFIIVQAIKGLRLGSGSPLFLPAPTFAQRGYGWKARCGCSSVVEHLLAKEDVASSSLVTRSSLRFGAQSRDGGTKAGTQPKLDRDCVREAFGMDEAEHVQICCDNSPAL